MKPIKQSFVWWSARARGDYEPAELAEAAKQIGYDAMEMAKPEELPIIKDAGLDISLIMGHESLADGLNKPENHPRIEAELAENIELAAEWDVPVLCCLSGNRYEGVSDLRGAEITAEILAKMAPAAEKAGVTLCMELLNSKVDHAGYMCDRTEWGVHVCKMVNSPAVRLIYDIYHMQIMEGDLIRTIWDNIEWIGWLRRPRVRPQRRYHRGDACGLRAVRGGVGRLAGNTGRRGDDEDHRSAAARGSAGAGVSSRGSRRASLGGDAHSEHHHCAAVRGLRDHLPAREQLRESLL